MGNCQDCSRSITNDKLLQQEAKWTYTKEVQTVDETLLNIVTTSTSKIFNNAIGQYVYETLINEEYVYIEDVLYDLDCYQSNIISLSTHKIINNKLIKYQWNDNDREILYKLLLNIFKHKISNIDALLNKFVPKRSLRKCTQEQLISNIHTIVCTIYDDNTTPSTDIQYLQKCFVERNINGDKLANMSIHNFVTLAKEYNISASKARKLLNAFKQYSFECNETQSIHIAQNDKDAEDVLNDEISKNRALKLCNEENDINEDGTDKGFVKFLELYLYTKNVNDIFAKSGDIECISNTNDLMNALSISIILYRVKVFQNRNENGDHKLRIDKSEIFSISKYISNWIVLHYGSQGIHFKMTKTDFQQNIHLYFEEFVKTNTKQTPL